LLKRRADETFGSSRKIVTQEAYDELLKKHQALESKYEKILSFVAYLKRMLFGRRSERLVSPANSLQPTLFDLEPVLEEIDERKDTITYERRKASRKGMHQGRNPFTEDMPAEEKEILHEAADPDTMQRIGDSITEQLSMKPAQLFVKRFIYPKYLDTTTGIILQASAVQSAFSRFKVDETVAAHVVVQKTVDHLPLYRQARIFERQKVTLAESTLGDIYSHVAKQLLPLYEAHRREVMDAGYLNVDETGSEAGQYGIGRALTLRPWQWMSRQPVGVESPCRWHPPAAWRRH